MIQVLIHKIRLLLTCIVLFGCSNGTNLLGGFNSRQNVESQTSNVSSENSTQQQQGVTQSTDLGDGRVVSDATDTDGPLARRIGEGGPRTSATQHADADDRSLRPCTDTRPVRRVGWSVRYQRHARRRERVKSDRDR